MKTDLELRSWSGDLFETLSRNRKIAWDSEILSIDFFSETTTKSELLLSLILSGAISNRVWMIFSQWKSCWGVLFTSFLKLFNINNLTFNRKSVSYVSSNNLIFFFFLKKSFRKLRHNQKAKHDKNKPDREYQEVSFLPNLSKCLKWHNRIE